MKFAEIIAVLVFYSSVVACSSHKKDEESEASSIGLADDSPDSTQDGDQDSDAIETGSGRAPGENTLQEAASPATFVVEGFGICVIVHEDGSVSTRGSSYWSQKNRFDNPKLSSGVKEVVTNHFAFTAIKEDGSAVVWGNTKYGGDSTPELDAQLSEGVKSVVAISSLGSGAFAALRDDGSVVSWGDRISGGNSSEVRDDLATGVTSLYGTDGAFAALKEDGSVVSWGNLNSGGDSSDVSEHLQSNVQKIFALSNHFFAVKENGSIVAWGDGSSNGSILETSFGPDQFERFVESYNEVFALLKDGTVLAWEKAKFPWSGFLPQPTIVTSGDALALISDRSNIAILKQVDEDGNVGSIDWGAGSGSLVSLPLGSSTLAREIFPLRSGFASILETGFLLMWGDESLTPDSDEIKSQLSSGVVEVASSAIGLAARKSDGSVVAWNKPSYLSRHTALPDSVKSGVVKLYSCGDGFAALKEDGSVVTWGYGF